MSRTRLIRPEFFSDGLMARLSVAHATGRTWQQVA